ncbi:natterin-3-like [Leuresthes tenuis]|uniref:natterin-3-like n=1 Tax=Leuresthes tenuis TaxID=355514 RepID=UPI003B512B54
MSTYHLQSVSLLEQHPVDPPSTFDDNGKLKWQKWQGYLPDGAVSIYNTYAGRTDYICKYKCHAGFYNTMDSRCNYPDKGYGKYSFSFEILVNEDHFERLEWKEGYYGSVPQHPIRTCADKEIYVGKNKYGLGMVHRDDKSFYLPWESSEYWYRSYEVLTIIKGFESQHIFDFTYHTDEAKTVEYPPENMETSTITNYECSKVSKTESLTKSTMNEKRWDITGSIRLDVRTTWTVSLPAIASGEIESSIGVSFQFSGGRTWQDVSSHTISITLSVPANSRCKVKMVGYKHKTDIPFTAHVSRTFDDGETKTATITGTYRSVQTGEIRTDVDRCEALRDATAC